MSATDVTKDRGLRARMVKGGVWTIAGFGVGQFIRLGSNLIMTRLLAPEAFGLMAIAATFEFWLNMMSDLGIATSIMRSKNGEQTGFVATARTLNFVRCILVAIFLVVIGFALPWMAARDLFADSTIFADPRLPVFLFIVAAAVLLSGFSTMRVALYNRRLDLLPLVRLEISAQIAAVVAMIGSALAGAGVYSLGIGMFAAYGLKTVGSFVMLKGERATFEFHRGHFKEIFDYGKWILIASTFGFLVIRGDQMIFGWLMNAEAFSLFAIAAIWIMAARDILENLFRRIVYPALSELHRDRPEDIPAAYSRMRLVAEGGCLFLFLGVILFADLAISILYREAYSGVSHYMKLLSVALLIVPYRLMQNVILTAGDSRSFSFVTILPGFALFIGAPLVFKAFGADAAIVYSTLTPIAALPLTFHFARRRMKVDYGREIANAVFACAAGAMVLRFA